METIEICGQSFDLNLTYFSFKWPFQEIKNMGELRKLVQFSNLDNASFSTTNLNDAGLREVCNCSGIDNLNLQDTKISSKGIRYLSDLKKLKYLRLKENDQLTNEAVPHFNKLNALIDLQIHETSIDQEGLALLDLPNLEDLLVNIWDGNYSYDFLLDLSKRLSNCTILAKSNGEFYQGTFKGTWKG